MAEPKVQLFTEKVMAGNLKKIAQEHPYLEQATFWKWAEVKKYLLSVEGQPMTGMELVRVVCEAFRMQLRQLDPGFMSSELFIVVLRAIAADGYELTGAVAYLKTFP